MEKEKIKIKSTRKNQPKKEIKVTTIGTPKLSALSKDEYNSFISCLEFEISNYYKDKNKRPN